jgi:hypothetical protein
VFVDCGASGNAPEAPVVIIERFYTRVLFFFDGWRKRKLSSAAVIGALLLAGYRQLRAG